VLTVVGLLLTGAGIALAFVDAFVKSVGDKRAIIGVALVLFAAGVVVLVVVSTKSLSNNERPQIATTASLAADGSKLEGHVTAFGVKAKQWIYVSVVGLASAKVEEGVPLYKTRAGPGRNGKVDLSFAIPVAFNHFQRVRIGAARVDTIEKEKNDPCFESSETKQQADDSNKPKPEVNQSCATVFSPTGSKRPTLSATWEKSGTDNVISVTVKTAGVDPDHVILLDMAGSRAQRRARGAIFYRSMLSGSSTGAVDATAKVPVPKGVKRVCVVGSTISATDSTTLKTQPKTHICALRSLDLSQSSFAVITVP
jgi:hypothetical protein